MPFFSIRSRLRYPPRL